MVYFVCLLSVSPVCSFLCVVCLIEMVSEVLYYQRINTIKIIKPADAVRVTGATNHTDACVPRRVNHLYYPYRTLLVAYNCAYISHVLQCYFIAIITNKDGGAPNTGLTSRHIVTVTLPYLLVTEINLYHQPIFTACRHAKCSMCCGIFSFLTFHHTFILYRFETSHQYIH